MSVECVEAELPGEVKIARRPGHPLPYDSTTSCAAVPAQLGDVSLARTRSCYAGDDVRARATCLAAAALTLACADLRPPSRWDESANATSPSVDADPPPATVDADDFGVGWLERDGVFESYTERIRMPPRARWMRLPDDLVALALPSAGAGFYSLDDEIGLYFLLERHIEIPPEVYRPVRIDSTLQRLEARVPEPPMTARVGGRELVFDAFSGGPLDNDYLLAVDYIEHDQVLHILAWYPRSGERELLRERIRERLAEVVLLTHDEVEALRSELIHGPDTQNQVGPSWSLRRGVFRDFEHDFEWKSPGRDWMVHAGPLAKLHPGEGTVVIKNRMEHLVGQLTVYSDPRFATVESDEFHELLAAHLIEQGMRLVGARRHMAIGSSEALVQALEIELFGMPMRYTLATIKHGELALGWVVGGSVRRVEANPALVDAVFLNTRVEAGLVAAAMNGSQVIDLRLGYRLKLPAGYERTLERGLEMDNGAEVASWSAPDRRSSVAIFALPWAGSGEVREGVMLGAQQSLAATFGPPTSTRSAELDGVLGEHLRWDEQDRDALIVTRDSTMIALAVESDDPKLFAQMREGFAFVD